MEPIVDVLVYLSLLSSGLVVVKVFLSSYERTRHISWHFIMDASVVANIEQVQLKIGAVPLFFTYLRRKIPSAESSSEEDSNLLCF